MGQQTLYDATGAAIAGQAAGAAIDAGDITTGTLAVARGGTNLGSYTAGDIVYASDPTTISKLAIGAAFKILRVNPGATAPEWGSVPYILLQDQKAQNTSAGTFTSGAWQTRTLNTEVTDIDGLCSLSSNQITLSAGTYRARWRAPAYRVDSHQSRLYNVTDTAVIALGGVQRSGNTDITSNDSGGEAYFTIAASKALEVQHQCGTTQATNGFGLLANFAAEIYTSIELWRVA